MYFITAKLHEFTAKKPLTNFAVKDEMVKPFDRYTIIGVTFEQCQAACFLDIDICSYFYMDTDVCYIGYYLAWAGYQNFLSYELSKGTSQLYIPKQLRVTNDFDFYQLKFPYTEGVLVSKFDKIPKDKHCNAMAFQLQYDFYSYNRFQKQCYLGNANGKIVGKSESIKLSNIFVNPIQPFEINDHFAASSIDLALENVYDYFWPLESTESCAIGNALFFLFMFKTNFYYYYSLPSIASLLWLSK